MVGLPQEQHGNEQYFFDMPTREWLTKVLVPFGNAALVGLPTIAKPMRERNPNAVLFDIDERFADFPGFVKWNLYRPESMDQRYGVIACDPPFKSVSLSQLFNALRILSQGRFDQPLLITGLAKREADILATFHPFALKPTGVQARYVSVQDQEGRNRIMFYSNFPVN